MADGASAAQHALNLRRRAAATVDAIRMRFPDLRRDELWRHHPYREPQVLERWERHLAAAGLLKGPPG